ncbi:ATP-binding protein [Roseovarius indicus]|uniref:ATP-binding protein n=1 Tax=Roseovarius indicus TaxID=540747 RepID=UPI0032EFA757
MTKMLRTRLLVVVLFLGAVGACAAGIWRYAHVEALAQIEKQGRADLALASDRFTGELRRFRELAVLMAEHPVFDDLTAEDGVARADWVLQDAADKSGALALFYTDTAGTVLARAGNVTLRPAGSRYFRRAMRGALGTFYGRLGPDGVRVYAFAAPAFGPDGVKGSVIALVDMAEVEWDWIGGQPPVFFTDADGRIFLSNRSEILGWQPRENGEAPAPPIEPAPDFSAVWRSGYEIWRLDWGDYLPRAALHLAKAEPVIGMTGHALVDTAPARRIAWLQTSVFTVICLSFGVVLLLLGERRRTLARANAQLETRVSERTAELSEANIALRREVQERQEAEAALKRAQDELVQAGKLSALGQMSAGISHELNQPLMAIQQFADNGGSFLAKGRTDAAGENLNRISQLAARAARIIKNLRAFARNESEPMGKVDLVQVIETAVELTDARLRKDEVTLDWQAPAQPVYALGGEVRLVQVFVNLINNAADAMSGQVERRISIAIDAGPPLAVTVRDIGPGISAPDKMFEPFYTTKAVGSDDGMGLGLSISYGLVQSFGGNIRGTNAPGGGAMMTVELERWQEEAAA